MPAWQAQDQLQTPVPPKKYFKLFSGLCRIAQCPDIPENMIFF
jgi:hypothetical protein